MAISERNVRTAYGGDVKLRHRSSEDMHRMFLGPEGS